MAADQRGERNRPIYLGSGASADAEDLTELGKRIADLGTRRVGTTDERNGLDPAEKFDGLLFFDLTLSTEYVLIDGGWKVTNRLDTGWIPMTMASGPSGAVWVRRLNGFVALRGSATPSAENQTQFTLPVGFRPIATISAIAQRNDGTRFTANTVQITGAGAARYITGGGGGSVDWGGFAPFPADQ